MPTYQYRCEKCGKRFERTETISEHEVGRRVAMSRMVSQKIEVRDLAATTALERRR
jgi:putative FmdB family regulatory protein